VLQDLDQYAAQTQGLGLATTNSEQTYRVPFIYKGQFTKD